MGWNTACKYAPSNSLAIHCKKENEGQKSANKAVSRGGNVGKGMFGCARHCRFFEPKSGGPGRYNLSSKKGD